MGRFARNRSARFDGYILMPVVIMLAVVATVSYLLSLEGAMGSAATARELEAIQAQFVAEAGYSEAKWRLDQNTACTGYADLPATAFGPNSYRVGVLPTSGSPVTFTSTAVLATTAQSMLQKTAKAYQAPSVIVLQPGAAGEDTYLWDGAHQDKNFGASANLYVNNQSAEETSLLRFDLSTLPPGKVISATLDLYMKSGANLSNGVLDVHRITRKWFEGIDDDANPSAPGATYNKWNGFGFGFNSWTTPGGDYEATPAASITVPSLVPGFYQWDATALVSAWTEGAANNGLLLRAGGGTVDKVRFTSGDGADAFRHPKLTINYACECGAACAVAGGAGKNLLFVVGNDANLTPEEIAHRTLVESWGYTVEVIDDDASATEFDTAVANNDVAFTTNDITASRLGTKLVDAPIGVVTSEDNLSDEFGLASSITFESGTVVEINDNTHFITSPFSLGLLTILSSSESLAYVTGTLAPDLGKLASSTSGYGVVTLDSGATMYSGGSAAGRRAQLPWGGNGFDPNNLTADGLTILERALEWGAGAGASASICNADYTPDNIVFEFSTAGYPQRLNRGVTYFPEGQVLNGVTSPVGGAWIAVGGSGILWIVGMDGSELDGNYTTGLSELEGIAFVPAVPATDPGHLAIVKGSTLYYSDMTLPANSSFTNHSLPFVNNAGGITYIDGGAYDKHLAIADENSSEIHIVDESFNLVTTLNTAGLLDKPEGIAHLKNTDKFLVLDTGLGAALVIDTDLAVSQNYDLLAYGLADGGGAGAAIHPSSCDHVFGDRPNNRYAYLNTGGGGGGGEGGGVVYEEFTEAKLDTNGTSLNIAGPAGTSAGDLLIAAVATDGSTKGSLAPPAGWNEIDLDDKSSIVTLGVWWKISGGSEPANYTFSWSSGEHAYGMIMRFTGHDAADPIHISNSAGGTSSAPTSPAVTTTVANALILRIGGFDDDDITVDNTGLSGHTDITMDESGTGTSSTSGGAGYVVQPAAGDSGTATFALTASEEYRAVTIAIAPAP